MALNLKESLKYGVLSVFVNLFHLCDVFIMSPCRGLHNIITVTPKSKMMQLEKSYRGKNCIVTGGSSGIGMELALLLSSLGANVIISSRKLDMLELVATRCRLLHPKAVIIPIALDLEKYENIAEYTAQVMDKLQKNNLPLKIDVLINNAGLSSRGAAMDTSMATLEKMMVSSRRAHYPQLLILNLS
jgi:NADPH:quinone reductase-like Zn-dependent oxidoreductase